MPAKIIVMQVQDPAREEALVSDISRFANSQNAVRQSDLSANKPFHVEVENAFAYRLLPRRRRALVLRAGGRKLQHAAGPRGNDAGETEGLKEAIPADRGRSPRRIWPNTSTPGTEARRRQPGFAEELRPVHGDDDRRGGESPPPAPDVAALQGDGRQGHHLQGDAETRPPDVPGIPGKRRCLHSRRCSAEQLGERFDLDARLGPARCLPGTAGSSWACGPER